MKWIGFAAVTLLSIIALGYVYLIAVKWLVAPDLFFNPSAWSSTGVFGDTFGGLTAIFSALASAGVVYSLIQQQKVLDRQEEEIKDNKNLAIEQMNLIKAQTFDAAFYNMLAIFNSMKSATYGGTQFQVHYENNLNENSHMRKVVNLDEMKRRYTKNLSIYKSLHINSLQSGYPLAILNGIRALDSEAVSNKMIHMPNDSVLALRLICNVFEEEQPQGL